MTTMTAGQTATRSHNLRLMFAAMACCNAADMLIWLRPPVIAEYVTQRGISNADAGLIATCEMVVLALTMMLWGRFAGPVRFRTIAFMGFAITVLGSLASMLVGGLPALLSVRIISAVGFGILSLVPTMAIARLPNAQGVYGRMYTVSMVFSAMVLTSLPLVTTLFDRPPGFPAYMIFATLLLPVALMMPAGAICDGKSEEFAATVSGPSRRNILFLAAGLAIIGLAFHVTWTFFMMLAGRAGLTPDQASTVTALSTLGSIAGSLLSAPLSRLIGTGRMMIVATVGVCASMLVVLTVQHPILFTVAGLTTLVFLFLMFPAVLGTAALIDPTGRGSAFTNAASMLGGAAGPYVGGLIIDLSGYGTLGAVPVIACILAWILYREGQRGV